MKFDIVFERVYSHSLESVWRALTDPVALGQWLMKTDFIPEESRSFQMWCENPDGGTDRYLCKVLVIDPPVRMLWSWMIDGRQSEGETLVEFKLVEVVDGTRLTVRHSGDRDRATIEAFKTGWPHKLTTLDSVLGTH